MYLGEDYIVNDKITITQPSIIDIAKFGEAKYFNMVYSMCSIPSDYKSNLWDIGYDYCKISDFECFILLTRDLKATDTSLLFGNTLSFADMVPAINPVNDELVLVDFEKDIVIDDLLYSQIIEYIREMHGIKVKREKAANKETKQILIDEDRMKKRLHKNEPKGSILLPLISAMVNSPGFKYNIEDLKHLGIYAFMDSVQRIPAINTANAILNGMYCGMVDLSKNKNLTNNLDWFRDLSKDSHKVSNVTVTENKS